MGAPASRSLLVCLVALFWTAACGSNPSTNLDGTYKGTLKTITAPCAIGDIIESGEDSFSAEWTIDTSHSSLNEYPINRGTCGEDVLSDVSDSSASIDTSVCGGIDVTTGLTFESTSAGGTLTLSGNVLTVSRTGGYKERPRGQSVTCTTITSGTLTRVK